MCLAPLPTAVNFLGMGWGEEGTCPYKSNRTSKSFEGPSRSHCTYMNLPTNSIGLTLTHYVTCYMLPVTAKQNAGLKQKFQATEPCLEHAPNTWPVVT